MAVIDFQRWQRFYLKALQQPLGSSDLLQRVKEAEAAISQRIEQLRSIHNGSEERLALGEAQDNLRHLMTENLKHTFEFASNQVAPG